MSQPNAPLWDAINQYAATCVDAASGNPVSGARMDAVAAVERATSFDLLRLTEPCIHCDDLREQAQQMQREATGRSDGDVSFTFSVNCAYCHATGVMLTHAGRLFAEALANRFGLKAVHSL